MDSPGQLVESHYVVIYYSNYYRNRFTFDTIVITTVKCSKKKNRKGAAKQELFGLFGS